VSRITNSRVTSQVLADINSAQNRLDVTQEQLSSGKKILQPSDDPYGASQSVRLDTELSQINDYTDNVQDGTSWTQAADSSLTSIQNETERVRELVVEAANGSNSQSDLDSINSEVTQLTAAIKQDANAQYNGQYIFSGSATSTAPYSTSSDAYQGNSGSVTRTIGPGQSVAVNADLNSVLGSGSSAADGKLLDVLSQVSAHLTGGTQADRAALSNGDLANLDSNLSTLEQVQTSVGSVSDRLTLASDRLQSMQTSDTTSLSNYQDADYATTMTDFTNEQAAFTAALKASANIVQSSLMDFLQ
jgi:flagellar hook-associated protein 3 FlgL